MATQVSLNDGAVASAGALAIQTNGTTQAVSISTGQVATLAQNPVLTSGTANGVAYLNGSKALTTGSALVFDGTKLGVGAAATEKLQSNAGIAATGANLSVGSLDGFVADYSSGVSRLFASRNGVATGTMAFWTTDSSGTAGERMRLDSSGNVGIGTSSPAYKLDVSKAAAGDVARFTNGGASNKSLFVYTDATYAAIATGVGASGNGIAFDAVNNKVLFTTASTNQMFLDSSGNFGLGVTPSANAGQSTLSISNYNRTFSALTLGSNANSAGYIGYNMGNTSTSNTWKYISADTGSALYFAGNEFRFMQFASGSAGATTSGTQAMTLDASGNLLVGGTTSYGKLTITGTASGTLLSINGASGQDCVMRWASNGTNKAIGYWEATNDRLYFANGSSGGVYLSNGGTSWVSVSDERIKDIIEPIKNANEKIANWRTVIGKYKTDEANVRRSFLIAQDVLDTFPVAVDATNIDEYGVRYQDTIPLLVAAIKEQQALITQLTARITALEGA